MWDNVILNIYVQVQDKMPQSSPMESNWKVLADGKMNLSQYNTPGAKVTKCNLGCI